MNFGLLYCALPIPFSWPRTLGKSLTLWPYFPYNEIFRPHYTFSPIFCTTLWISWFISLWISTPGLCGISLGHTILLCVVKFGRNFFRNNVFETRHVLNINRILGSTPFISLGLFILSIYLLSWVYSTCWALDIILKISIFSCSIAEWHYSKKIGQFGEYEGVVLQTHTSSKKVN